MTVDRGPNARRRLPGGARTAAGLGVLGLLLAIAVAGPRLSGWRYDDVDFAAFGAPPSTAHWFGTTQDGRDVYALTVRGLRTSLLVGLLVALGAGGAAAAVGSAAGYLGGLADRLLMGVADLLLALPAFLLALVAAPALRGRSPVLLAGLLAAGLWMATARAVRAMTLSLGRRDYVVAARTIGAGPGAIIRRHILPHLAPVLAADAALNAGTAIVAESGLSYLGLGVQPPDGSLGTLLADGAEDAAGCPWTLAVAAGLLVLVVLAVNLVGDGLCDAVDPAAAARPPSWRRWPR